MKTYKGVRRSDGSVEVFVVEYIPNSDGLERRGCLEHRFRHSHDGFEWGYGGSGPADLAFSILWDYLGPEIAESCYMEFKWSVVSVLNRKEWTLTTGEIDQWLNFRMVKK